MKEVKNADGTVEYHYSFDDREFENRMNTLAENLKRYREKAKLSHQRLHDELIERYGEGLSAEETKAKRYNISKSSLLNYEVSEPFHAHYQDVAGMNIGSLFYLAKFYDVSVDRLLGTVPEENPSPDETVRLIAEYTHLSDAAIKALHEIPRYYFGDIHTVLNDIFENSVMYSMLFQDLYTYLHTDWNDVAFALNEEDAKMSPPAHRCIEVWDINRDENGEARFLTHTDLRSRIYIDDLEDIYLTKVITHLRTLKDIIDSTSEKEDSDGKSQ